MLIVDRAKFIITQSLLSGAVRHGFAIKMEKKNNSLFWIV